MRCIFSRAQWLQLHVWVSPAQVAVSGDCLLAVQFRGGVPSLPGVCDLSQGLAVGADFLGEGTVLLGLVPRLRPLSIAGGGICPVPGTDGVGAVGVFCDVSVPKFVSDMWRRPCSFPCVSGTPGPQLAVVRGCQFPLLFWHPQGDVGRVPTGPLFRGCAFRCRPDGIGLVGVVRVLHGRPPLSRLAGPMSARSARSAGMSPRCCSAHTGRSIATRLPGGGHALVHGHGQVAGELIRDRILYRWCPFGITGGRSRFGGADDSLDPAVQHRSDAPGTVEVTHLDCLAAARHRCRGRRVGQLAAAGSACRARGLVRIAATRLIPAGTAGCARTGASRACG